MRAQQGCDYRSRPFGGRAADDFKRFDLGVDGQAVSRFSFDRGRALLRHLMQRVQHFVHQLFLAGLAHALNARTNSAAGFRDLLVGCAGDALLEIHQPRRDEHGMSMRIHESGQDDLSRAIELDDFPAILSDPGIAQRVFGFARRDNLPAHAQDRAILDDAEFLEIAAAARAGTSGSGAQGQQLADIHQQQHDDQLMSRFWLEESRRR